MFVEAGGLLKCTGVQSLRQSAAGWELNTEQGTETTPRLVVCMGAWTPAIIGQLGYSNPLAVERGYHTVFTRGRGSKTVTSDLRC